MTRTRLPRVAALCLSALLVALAAPADAQRSAPGDYGSGQGGRNAAGQFDYYALVLSWSPTHCSTVQSSDNDQQCNRRDGRRYGFVLHGLWPQHERGYPEYCPTRNRPFVPQDVIDGMLDIMPSPRLVIHEYRKHGVCTGLSATEYYTLSRRLFEKLKVPDDYINPQENRMVSPDDLVDEFVALNPSLKPDMLAVSCGGSGNRLREVRICLTRNGDFRSCGRNEDPRRLCNAQRMFVPPVRSTKIGPETPIGKRDLRAPLPGQRDLPISR